MIIKHCGMRKKLDKQILDAMSRDPGNWKGPFYFNKKDPRLRVPKLNPMMGYTWNFASPYAWVAIILIVVVIILMLVL